MTSGPTTFAASPVLAIREPTQALRYAQCGHRVARGQVTGLDLSVRRYDENFGITFSGFITVARGGEYTIYLKRDSGALLRMHEATVIDDYFRHTGGEVSGSIRLQAGRHRFRLYYRRGSGPRLLTLDYFGPSTGHR